MLNLKIPDTKSGGNLGLYEMIKPKNNSNRVRRKSQAKIPRIYFQQNHSRKIF